MFNKIFTPKLQHPDPQKRMAALQTLTASDQDIVLLCELAINDPDSEVRGVAVEHLTEQISDQSNIDAQTAMKLFNIASHSNKEKFIAHLNDEQCLCQFIAGTDDQKALMLLASKSALPAARKKAVEKISGLDNLKQLQLQSKDKNVQQLVRQKIHLIKSQQKARDAAHETLNQICDALERLSKSEFEPMMISRVRLLESHWNNVDDQYKSDFAGRYDRAHGQCYQIIEEIQRQQAMAEFEKSQNEVCQAVCQSYQNEISQLTVDAIGRWYQSKVQIERRWLSCVENFSPMIEISERFYTLKSAAEKIDSIIDAYASGNIHDDSQQIYEMDLEELDVYEQKLFKLNRQLSWSYKFKQPELFLQIKNLHSQAVKLLKEKKAAQKKRLAQIDSKIAVLKSLIRQKNLIKANRMLNYIQSQIDELPEALRLKEHDKLNPVIISLNDLRGFNEFVTGPKKLELCEQMEELSSRKIAPEKLMDEIKKIQTKWKSLATSDAQADDILWERFKQAADKAFVPCAEYLENLEKLKNDNLAARAALIEQLEKELKEQSWDNVDWKSIQAGYSSYWKQWKSLTPVFFSQNRPLQKKFEALTGEIKDRLDNEKNENHQLYEQLIDRVSLLSESLTDENIDDAIAQVKRIQASWKNVGITHFKKSRNQWNRFKKTCDKIFDHQRQMYKSLRLKENQQQDQLHALINEIKALIRLPDEQFADSQSDYQALVDAFSISGDLPDAQQEKIQRLFDRVCEDYQSHLAGLGKRTRLQAHKLVRKAASLCCKAESMAISGANRTDFDALKVEYETLPLDSTIADSLTQRFADASNVLASSGEFSQEKLALNEQALSELAIKLEVLFDLQTPEHALKQRMDYQLEQLQSGIKPALPREERQAKLLQFELEWYQIGAVSIEARSALEARLAKIIKKAE